MKPQGEHLTFSEREQQRYGLPESVHLNELPEQLIKYQERRDRWFEAACTPTPYMSEHGVRQELFVQATDFGLLLNKMIEHVPAEIAVDEAEMFLRDLETDN